MPSQLVAEVEKVQSSNKTFFFFFHGAKITYLAIFPECIDLTSSPALTPMEPMNTRVFARAA